MAVGEHEVPRSALGLQPDRNIGDAVVEAGEASQEVDGEGAGGALDVHGQLMGPGRRLHLNVLDLLQQVAHGQDLVLLAAHGPGPHAGDPLQVSPGAGDKGRSDERAKTLPRARIKVDSGLFIQSDTNFPPIKIVV